MKPQTISSTLILMASHKSLRKLLAKKVDDYLYKNMVNGTSEDLKEVQIKRYQFLSAMLRCVNKNIDRGYVSPEIIKKIVNVFVQNNLIRDDQTYTVAVERYREKYG